VKGNNKLFIENDKFSMTDRRWYEQFCEAHGRREFFRQNTGVMQRNMRKAR
jgi:hypothetical protein